MDLIQFKIQDVTPYFTSKEQKSKTLTLLISTDNLGNFMMAIWYATGGAGGD
jgi:hypothetical protein